MAVLYRILSMVGQKMKSVLAEYKWKKGCR